MSRRNSPQRTQGSQRTARRIESQIGTDYTGFILRELSVFRGEAILILRGLLRRFAE